MQANESTDFQMMPDRYDGVHGMKEPEVLPPFMFWPGVSAYMYIETTAGCTMQQAGYLFYIISQILRLFQWVRLNEVSPYYNLSNLILD